MADPDFPNADQHTPCPDGYVAWHEWATRMSKTHRQVRCRGCNRWSIWRALMADPDLTRRLRNDADRFQANAEMLRPMGGGFQRHAADMRAAADRIDQLEQQLADLHTAIGDPNELRRAAVSVGRDRKVTNAEAERRILALTRLAAAVEHTQETT